MFHFMEKFTETNIILSVAGVLLARERAQKILRCAQDDTLLL
jgi:hypothetical protein